MNTTDFDYHLPFEFIAQTPSKQRDHSRLMVINRSDCSIEHNRFYQITEFLQAGDVLVFNDSRVIPARLAGIKAGSDTKVELLLLRRLDDGIWETLVRPGKKLNPGAEIILTNGQTGQCANVQAIVKERGERGLRVVHFSNECLLDEFGEMPLPPYIKMPLAEPERYQTVYARIKGSAAAPTAGLHFTPELLGKLQKKGVQLAFVTLHIGLDTFQPVRVQDAHNHQIHSEFGHLSSDSADLINSARELNGRVVAVGTSVVRLLEASSQSGTVKPYYGQVNLFILPGYKFLSTDAMITNFHLPKSTLIMLVSAFAGKNFIFKAYKEAINEGYRFYSFGDAMLIH